MAVGDKALELTLSRIRKTIALLEPMVEKLKTKPKPRNVHTVEPMDEFPIATQVRTEIRTKNREMDQVYRIDSHLMKSGKWWNANFKYPCQVESHNHELYQCGVFIGMTPKERHDKLKGRICRTCLRPGGICITKEKRCSTKLPKDFACEGCVHYTQGRKLSPHSVLYCTSARPEHIKPSKPEFYRILQSTLGGN